MGGMIGLPDAQPRKGPRTESGRKQAILELLWFFFIYTTLLFVCFLIYLIFLYSTIRMLRGKGARIHYFIYSAVVVPSYNTLHYLPNTLFWMLPPRAMETISLAVG